MARPAALTAEAFAAAMARLGPFEPRPRVAVAVSGGADSLALALLAHEWAGRRGGEAVALTVDHGLRPSSAARYRLLGDWCAAAGVLHLLLAHHREDQAETLLLRLGRGSGVDGLAGMAPVAETRQVRLLRPLLGISRERLRAHLRAAGQAWIEDPSNDSAAFARVRLRRLAPDLAAEGLTPERLAATAARLGRARAALEAAAAAAAAEDVALHPELWAEVDSRLLRRPEEIALRVLARLLAVVGGSAYPPRLEGLERLAAALRGDGGGRTLAGCRVLPGRGRFRVFREAAAVAPPVTVAAGDDVLWDGRFRVAVAGPAGATATLRALPVEDLAPELRRRLPRPALAGLPCLCDAGGILAVPHLGYNRNGPGAAPRVASVRAAPPLPLTGGGHRLVWEAPRIIS